MTSFMTLKLFVQDEDLRSVYSAAVSKHNHEIHGDYPNAGFDLFLPNPIQIINEEKKRIVHPLKLDMEIKCAAFIDGRPVSYYMYPRSSMIKTPFRLANSVGIIDSGYRGNIIAAMDVNTEDAFSMDAYTRLVQLCAPDLRPIEVELVDSVDALSKPTSRGEGGFGSTGI